MVSGIELVTGFQRSFQNNRRNQWFTKFTAPLGAGGVVKGAITPQRTAGGAATL